MLIFLNDTGGDTTATGMAAALFYISRHRDCYDRLAAEIRSAFGSGSDINGPKLTACSYLRACIDEAMRMSPPLPGLLWRQLAVEEQGEGKPPLIIDGHIVPPGTDVAVSVYALHHNEVSNSPFYLVSLSTPSLSLEFVGSLPINN